MGEAWAAVDLRAEHGRVFVGRLDGSRLALQEVYRFSTRTVRVDGTLRWDIERVYGEILAGLGAARRAFPGLASVGIDAWGKDFGLLDARGRLLGAPFHHGDRSTDGIPARLHVRVPEAEIWAATGAQPVACSTLCQLFAMVRRRSSTLHRAVRMLLVPDLLSYWLSGVQVAEHTIATTTRCYDLQKGVWTAPLLVRAGIPANILPPVVPPGTRLGPLQAAAARRAGVTGLAVVAPACHETAAAVGAIPVERPSFAFIRSGPSSQVGTVLKAPLKAEAARQLGFTNEGGADGTVCLHRTVAGIQLMQVCRRAWARAGERLEDDALVALAASGKPFQAAVDLDDPALVAPDDLSSTVLASCERMGRQISGTRADLLRIVVESVAWKYRRTLRELEALLGRRLEVVHVIGEGARNALLCQLTADACGRPVLAGPVEAAALGNVLAQAVATGACASWGEARALARASVATVRYEPKDAAAWDEAAARLEPALEADRQRLD